jgi:hypothetical protein
MVVMLWMSFGLQAAWDARPHAGSTAEGLRLFEDQRDAVQPALASGVATWFGLRQYYEPPLPGYVALVHPIAFGAKTAVLVMFTGTLAEAKKALLEPTGAWAAAHAATEGNNLLGDLSAYQLRDSHSVSFGLYCSGANPALGRRAPAPAPAPAPRARGGDTYWDFYRRSYPVLFAQIQAAHPRMPKDTVRRAVNKRIKELWQAGL